MSSWFSYSLAAFFLMGIQGFLYKVAAEKQCDTPLTTFVFMSAVAALSAFAWAIVREPMGRPLILAILVIVNSLSFVGATMTFMEALKSVPATTAYSVLRLNLVLVVLFSVAWFGDHLSIYQVTGVVMALTAMAILAGNGEERSLSEKSPRRGLLFVIWSLLMSAVAAISSKFAAIYVGKSAFLTFVYSVAALTSLAFTRKPYLPSARDKNHCTLYIGIAIGILNFFGYYVFLIALAEGPLSLVSTITGLYFVVPVALSVIIYREPVTMPRLVGFLLTILSIIFMKLT